MSSGNTGEWFDDEAQPGEDLEYRKLQDSIKKVRILFDHCFVTLHLHILVDYVGRIP